MVVEGVESQSSTASSTSTEASFSNLNLNEANDRNETKLEAKNTLESADLKETGDEGLDLENAESKDPTKKLEIIKQIRKINKDGSYTVGYEAGDGTFKIESRDVLGNVKGTYGYVDANGEIKRVSYMGANGTSALKNYPSEVAKEELSTTLPNANMTRNQSRYNSIPSSTRRPASLQFLQSTTASSGHFNPKHSVIQTIPRRRIAVPSSTERSLYSHYATSKLTETSSTTSASSSHSSQEETTSTATTLVYAKSIPTMKPLLIIRPTTIQTTSTDKTPEQIGRPDKLEINHVSKVMVMKSSETSTSKSVGKEKDLERKSIRGNNLRRQLTQEREDHYEAQPQHLYSQAAGEDTTHVYDGTTGNLRPIYTSTSRPRVPSIVIAARQRAAELQRSIGSSSPTTTNEKVYVRPPPASIQYETTTEPAQESNYLTQTPGPVVQIPPNQAISQQATEDGGRVFRQRPAPFRQPLYTQSSQLQGTEPPRNLYRFPPPPNSRGPEQYIRETTPSPSRYSSVDDDDVGYGKTTRRPVVNPYSEHHNDGGYEQGSYPVPFQQPFRPYQQPGFGYGGDFPGRPTTSRDFERLLQLLVYRHQNNRFGGGFSAGIGGGGFGYQPPYYQGGGYPGIAPYLPNPYQGIQQYPRSQLYDPVGLDPRYSHLNRFGGFRQYSEPESSVYSGSQSQQAVIPDQTNQISQQQQQQSFDSQRLIPRQKAYNSGYYGANTTPVVNPYRAAQNQQQSQYLPVQQQSQPHYVPQQSAPDYSSFPGYSPQASSPSQQDYLPSEVREDLLYRMLMLAIQGQANDPMPQISHQLGSLQSGSDPIKATITNAPPSLRKPVRSVQIIGESEE